MKTSMAQQPSLSLSGFGGGCRYFSIKIFFLLTILAVFTLRPSLTVASTSEQAPSAQTIALMAAVCEGCHRPSQHPASNSTPSIPQLRNQSSAMLTQKLLDYRSGDRKATVMNRLARGYTETQLKAIAEYLSR